MEFYLFVYLLFIFDQFINNEINDRKMFDGVIDWLIDFYGMSTRQGLFDVKRLGLVFLFNGISNIVGYFNAKAIDMEQQRLYLTRRRVKCLVWLLFLSFLTKLEARKEFIPCLRILFWK